MNVVILLDINLLQQLTINPIATLNNTALPIQKNTLEFYNQKKRWHNNHRFFKIFYVTKNITILCSEFL